jgi:hypothetical protein
MPEMFPGDRRNPHHRHQTRSPRQRVGWTASVLTAPGAVCFVKARWREAELKRTGERIHRRLSIHPSRAAHHIRTSAKRTLRRADARSPEDGSDQGFSITKGSTMPASHRPCGARSATCTPRSPSCGHEALDACAAGPRCCWRLH